MNEVKCVIVSGGYRTGTTAVFNIVRRIFETVKGAGKVKLVGLSGKECEDYVWNVVSNDVDFDAVHIVKNHDVFFPTLPHNTKLIYCYRNPVDVVCSGIRMWAEEEKHRTEGNFPLFEQLRQLAENEYRKIEYYKRMDVDEEEGRVLVLDYDYWYWKEMERVRYIARFVGVELTLEEEEMVVRDTSVRSTKQYTDGMKGEMDGMTQLRRHHIGEHLGRPGYGFREIEGMLVGMSESKIINLKGHAVYDGLDDYIEGEMRNGLVD